MSLRKELKEISKENKLFIRNHRAKRNPIMDKKVYIDIKTIRRKQNLAQFSYSELIFLGMLKSLSPNIKIKRQFIVNHPKGFYLLDFFVNNKYAFEIDGLEHDKINDYERDLFCFSKGIKTFRFENGDVACAMYEVRLKVERILKHEYDDKRYAGMLKQRGGHIESLQADIEMEVNEMMMQEGYTIK